MQAETDRISSEIQKKKEREGRELEQEKIKKMVTYFFHDILDCEELSSCLTCVRVFHAIQLASAIIWVHVLYLKLCRTARLTSQELIMLSTSLGLLVFIPYWRRGLVKGIAQDEGAG